MRGARKSHLTKETTIVTFRSITLGRRIFEGKKRFRSHEEALVFCTEWKLGIQTNIDTAMYTLLYRLNRETCWCDMCRDETKITPIKIVTIRKRKGKILRQQVVNYE
jgi:hypothetical protein